MAAIKNKEGPAKTLKDFTGFLQTDGYGGYDQFYHRSGITMLHCAAHAGRYFKDAEDNDRERSSYALKVFQESMRSNARLREFPMRSAEKSALYRTSQRQETLLK